MLGYRSLEAKGSKMKPSITAKKDISKADGSGRREDFPQYREMSETPARVLIIKQYPPYVTFITRSNNTSTFVFVSS